MFGIGATALANAQTTTPTPAQTPATTPAPKPAEMKPRAEIQRIKNAIGTVKSTSADSVVVAGKEKVQGAKDAKDAEWTFAVDSKTAIRKSGKAITAGDLKPGDHVQVRYSDQQGKAMAVAIQVKPGAAAAKSTTPQAEKK